MAEASGGRTHRQQEDLPPAGFEDRDDHRTACASANAAATMLAAPRIGCIGRRSGGHLEPYLLQAN